MKSFFQKAVAWTLTLVLIPFLPFIFVVFVHGLEAGWWSWGSLSENPTSRFGKWIRDQVG